VAGTIGARRASAITTIENLFISATPLIVSGFMRI
jgi:hypothetical protein